MPAEFRFSKFCQICSEETTYLSVTGQTAAALLFLRKPHALETGFVHFFRKKSQGLFKDFPGPYFEISKTLRESNERVLGTKTSVFTHCEHFEDVILVYLKMCFHWLSFTIKPYRINIS